MVETLEDQSVGTWRITTRTGTRYLIDLDRRLIRREPAAGGSSAPMRGDGQDAGLLHLKACSIGSPLVALIDLHLSGSRTTRRIAGEVTRIRLAKAKAKARASTDR